MEEITKHKVIAVEGKDDMDFFVALLRNMNIADVQVIFFEGKTNFRAGIKSIVNIPGFRNVTCFALIRDADNLPPQSALDSIKQSLQLAHLPVPPHLNEFTPTIPSVGVFIMPGGSDQGMLEDLCLSSIRNHPVNKCIDAFIDCIDEKPDHESKSRILCYLATRNPIVNTLGKGALKGFWDFNSSTFEEVKGFLEYLR